MIQSGTIARRDVLAGLGGAVAAAALPASARATALATLELVATFANPRQVTGVAVSPSGRIFVNFPRWEEDVAISVAEVGTGGRLTPYPDASWNSYRDAAPRDPATHFVSVQSVVVDPLGYLWVLDPAAPGLSFEVENGPKAVKIDLATNRIVRVYPFGPDVAPQGTYLNDIRFTPDGRRAVLTNSGQPGSLLTLDVASGAIRRVLDNQPATNTQPGFVITVHGRPLRMLDGQPPMFAADGLAIDMSGDYVYWQATSGDTLYRVATADLFDTSLTPTVLSRRVVRLGRTVQADGLLVTRANQLYLTSDADNSVRHWKPDGAVLTQVRDARLLWPDSMAEGPDGKIYVTASHIPEMKMWQGPGVKQTALFRFRPQ